MRTPPVGFGEAGGAACAGHGGSCCSTGRDRTVAKRTALPEGGPCNGREYVVFRASEYADNFPQTQEQARVHADVAVALQAEVLLERSKVIAAVQEQERLMTRVGCGTSQ